MKIIVLFSGGLDSTVLLAQQVSQRHECLALSFRYGQTHEDREIAAAIDVAKHYEVEHRIIDIAGIFENSALTGNSEIPEGHAATPDSTTVPARNLVLLSIAASIAEQVGAPVVAFGANLDDANGYLDCRWSFCRALDEAISLGTGQGVSLLTPFVSTDKKSIVNIGRQLGVPFDLTWSCYRGGEEPCNRCGACESRNEALA